MKQVLESLGFEDIEVLEQKGRAHWVLLVIAFLIFTMIAHPGSHLDHGLHALLVTDWS